MFNNALLTLIFAFVWTVSFVSVNIVPLPFILCNLPNAHWIVGAFVLLSSLLLVQTHFNFVRPLFDPFLVHSLLCQRICVARARTTRPFQVHSLKSPYVASFLRHPAQHACYRPRVSFKCLVKFCSVKCQPTAANTLRRPFAQLSEAHYFNMTQCIRCECGALVLFEILCFLCINLVPLAPIVKLV